MIIITRHLLYLSTVKKKVNKREVIIFNMIIFVIDQSLFPNSRTQSTSVNVKGRPPQHTM